MVKVAYSEVLEVLDNMSEKDRQKIPEHIYEFFLKNQEKNYVKHLNKEVCLNKQEIRKETKAILALLLTNYLCDSEEKRNELNKMYTENETRYREQARNKYDLSTVLRTNNELDNLEEKNENSQMIEITNKNIFSKIIEKIRNFFKFK